MAEKQKGYTYRGYHIEDDILERLEKVSKEKGHSLKHLVNVALREHLDFLDSLEKKQIKEEIERLIK